MKQYIKRSVNYFWLLLAVVIIAAAVAVQLGRLLSPLVDDLRPEITDYLSQHFGADIDMQQLQLTWQELRLGLIVKQLTVRREPADSVLQVDHANMQLDMLASLLRGRLVWRHIVLHNAYIHIEQNSAGIWNLAGFSRTVDDQTESFYLSDLFVLSENVDLRNANLLLNFRTGQQTMLSIPTITVENDENFHRLQASANINGGNRIFHFVVEGVGDPRDRETFSAKGFLQLNDFPVSDFISALPRKSRRDDRNQWHQSSHINLRLWIDFLRPNQFAVQGDFTLKNLLSMHSGKPVTIAKSINSSFSGDVDLEGGSSLFFNNVSIDKNDQITLPSVNLHLSSEQFTARFDQVDLVPWTDWLIAKPFFKDNIKQALTQLSPVGTLKNVSVTGKPGDWRSLQLRSNIVDLDIAAWKKMPSLKGINGYLETTVKEGFIELETDNFRLFPQLIYNSELQLANTKGQIAWRLRPQKNSIVFNSGPLKSNSPYGRLNGVFYLDIPWKPRSRPGHFILQIGVQDAEVEDYRVFLPKKIPANVQTWLAASIGKDNGKIPAAGFIYNGYSVQRQPGAQSIQFFANVSQGTLNYSPQWPTMNDIKGQLIIDNKRVTADVKHARIYDATISDATVSWPNLNSKGNKNGKSEIENREPIRKLHIEGTAKGPAASGLRLLQESWLRTKVGAVFDHWSASGNLEIDLKLALPLLNTDLTPRYNIAIKLDDSAIELQDQRLSLRNLNGELTLDSESGFSSPGIDSTLWGYPLAIKLKNSIRQDMDYLSIEGQGRVDIKSVAVWVNRPELLFASGETDFIVKMQIPLKTEKTTERSEYVQISTEETEQTGNFTLTLESDLNGINIDLPAPFAKEATDPLPLNILLSAGNDHKKYDIRLGNLVKLSLAQQGSELTGAVLHYQTDETDIEKGKFLIIGHTKNFVVDRWREVIDRYQQHRQTLADIQERSDEPAAMNIEIDWSFDIVDVNDTLFENILLNVHRKADRWQADINSANIAGTAFLFDDQRTTRVELKKLHWPYVEHTEQGLSDRQVEAFIDPWATVDLSAIPPLDFSVDQLVLSGKILGRWKFKLRPINNGKGIELNDIYGGIEALNFAGNNEGGGYFRWDQAIDESERGRSQLIGVLQGGNIKPVLNKWQLSPLESKKSRLVIELSWPGSPRAFDLTELTGDIAVTMNDGRFIQAKNNEATDLLRLFGLFNFDTWARRLRFDFSDLYKRGLSFDQLEGRMEFDKGMIYLTKPLVVRGPSSDFKMAGKIDYENQKIDTSLVATLPVGGNLTLGVALAAGLPAAAGVYAISKLFKKQVDKVASLSYTVKGDWENPDIRFDKLFDEKAARKAGQTAEKEKTGKSLAK